MLEVHWGGACGGGGTPLDIFDDVEGGVEDEGNKSAFGRGEAGDAVASGTGGAEGVGEEGGVGGREDGEGIGHFQ